MKSYPKSIMYKTFTSEEAQGFPNGSYQKMFHLEPECVNLFIMIPGSNKNQIDNYTANGYITDYRLRIDNVDMVNRDIKRGGNLYQDRINMTLINAGKELKDMNQQILPANKYKPGGGDGVNYQIESIMTPTPLTATEKLLQVNITSKAEVHRLILYKQVVRQVNL